MATNGTSHRPGGFKLTVFGILILGAFLIMFDLVRGLYREHPPGPLDPARAAERIKLRQELAAKSEEALKAGGTVDAAKGIIRLPIDRAIRMTAEAYQNPAGARSNWIARAEKAAAPAPVQSFE